MSVLSVGWMGLLPVLRSLLIIVFGLRLIRQGLLASHHLVDDAAEVQRGPLSSLQSPAHEALQ